MANNEANILSEEVPLLLKRFNDRDEMALGEVYELHCRELHYFTKQLYRDTKVLAEGCDS